MKAEIYDIEGYRNNKTEKYRRALMLFAAYASQNEVEKILSDILLSRNSGSLYGSGIANESANQIDSLLAELGS